MAVRQVARLHRMPVIQEDIARPQRDRITGRGDDPWRPAGGSRHYRRTVDVRLLYFDGCPNWQETDRRLREAIAVAGLAVTPQYVKVETPEDAERLSFRGSPTVLVDGADAFADASAPVGLSCRVFQTPDGLRGAPTVEQLLAVLR